MPETWVSLPLVEELMATAQLTRGTRCPRCRAVTDLLETPEATLRRTPSVGDVVVCIRCAGALTVTNIGTVRELRDAEYRRLSPDHLLQLAQMQQRVAAGEFRKPKGARQVC